MHLLTRELTALRIYLKRVLPLSIRQTSILWRIDNTTALSHIKKEGGLRGRDLLEEAEKILLLAHQRQLRLLPVFIPLEENIQADAALRFLSIPDWHLSPRVFDQILSLRGPPLIDFFASRRSTQTRRFFAWNAADRPEVIDALSQRWDFSLAYLFPLIPLLKRVVRKLETSRGTFFLVTPFWDAQTWFASLLALAVEDVRHLPMSADLVIDIMTGEPPPILDRLFFVVWTISGGVGASTPSQTDRSISSRQGGSNPQKSAKSARGSPSRTSFTLPPFHSIRSL
jgi:hypothetical protein